MLKIIHMNVNGKAVELAIDDRESLLDTLRNHLGLTSVKKGCEVGECGACTVLDFFITFSEVFATVSVTPDKFFLSSSKNAIILPSCMNCMYYFWLLSCIVKNLFVSITIIYLYVRPVTSSLKVFRRFNLP